MGEGFVVGTDCGSEAVAVSTRTDTHMDAHTDPEAGTHTRSRRELTSRTKWCYGVGHVLNDLAAAAWFTYLLVYLRGVIPWKQAGYVFVSGQIADALATPTAGRLSDSVDGGYPRP